MKLFNFPKTKKRKPFTTIFGGVGKRRYAQDFTSRIPKMMLRTWFKSNKKFKMQWIRRSHQGWRNKTFGSIQALKIRMMYGRRKPTPQFRR